MLKKEGKPTSADLWETLLKQMDMTLEIARQAEDNAWKAGFYSGLLKAKEESDIETLLEETE